MVDARVGNPLEPSIVRVSGINFVDRSPAIGGVHEAVVDQRIDFGFGTILTDILHPAER